jgi:DNA-binding Lrp family transcriptional regulator
MHSEKIKLDAYDKKILLELYENARASTTSIGRKIRLKRENVDYKIRRLESLGLIKEYNTFFDENILGLKRHVFCLQLVNLHEEMEKKIMNYLVNHPHTTWIGPAVGKWSIAFDVVVKNNQKFSEVMKEFFSKYQNYIGDYISFSVEWEEVYFHKVMSEKSFGPVKKEKTNAKRRKEEKKTSLDGIDWKILKMLNANSKASYVDISLKTKLTANAIKKRIKSLEDAGIIQGYTISIDFRKLGYDWYTLNLNLARFGEDVENRLKMFARAHRKVIFLCRDNGQWEYDIGLFVKNSGELREFINELRSRFPEEVRIADVFITLEEVKGYKLPDGVFE